MVFYIGFGSWGCRAQGGGQAWEGLECLTEGILRGWCTIRTMPMTILGDYGGYQERKPGGVVRKSGVLTPRGVENSLDAFW